MNRALAPGACATPLVLVCDPEHGYIDGLLAQLALAGMRAVYASDGQCAVQLHAALEPDLVLVDGCMPVTHGLDVLRRIREHRATPVIMLDAPGAQCDRVAGLQAGADDVVDKPFNSIELVARIEAVLRRAGFDGDLPSRGVFRVHPFEVDQLEGRICLLRADGRHDLGLTHSEYQLCRRLLLLPGQLQRRADLQACLHDAGGSGRKVDTYISRLRCKLARAGAGGMIETVRKQGYVLHPAAGEAHGRR